MCVCILSYAVWDCGKEYKGVTRYSLSVRMEEHQKAEEFFHFAIQLPTCTHARITELQENKEKYNSVWFNSCRRMNRKFACITCKNEFLYMGLDVSAKNKYWIDFNQIYIFA